MFITERFDGCHGLRDGEPRASRLREGPGAPSPDKIGGNTLDFMHNPAIFDIL
jgi:hypothetical protein